MTLGPRRREAAPSSAPTPAAVAAPLHRWYRGYRTFAKPKEFVERVADCVQRHGLTDVVPGLRLERRAKGEFYFFIAINGPEYGVDPERLEDTLYRLPYFRSPVGDEAFQLEEIKGIVAGELDVEVLGRRIAYVRVEPEPLDDPFDLHTPRDREIPAADGAPFERLLAWMSATGHGTWASFVKACDALGLDRGTGASRRILRRLKLLGHAEASPDGSRWSVAPASLVALHGSGDAPEYAVCGQRTAAALELLASRGRLATDAQRGAPPRIRWSPRDARARRDPDVVAIFGPDDDAPRRLAAALPDLDGWREGLRAPQGIDPGLFNFRRHNGAGFAAVPFGEAAGLYQLFPRMVVGKPAPQDRPRYTLYYDARSKAWRQGDWYGLRFLDLRSAGVTNDIAHDAESGDLAVPCDERWPELYERAPVLASGLLPERRGDWLVYPDVGRELAVGLASKLGLCLRERGLD